MSETYTLMHIPVRLVETVQGIASGKLVAVPMPDSTAIYPEQDPETGRRGLHLVYLPSNPAGSDALRAVHAAAPLATGKKKRAG